LQDCLRQHRRIDNIVSIRRQIEGFIEDWGPHPSALYFAGRSCCPPYPDDPHFSTRWVSLHMKLFPQDPSCYENAADLALERSDYLQALALADRGLKVDPTYQGLLHTRLEVLASLGRYGEAESAMQAALALDPVYPRRHLIRGLMRAGRRMDAVTQVGQWVRHDNKPAAVALLLAAGPVTAPLVTDGNLRIPEFAQIPPGVDGELLGIVELSLHADGAKSFIGELPPYKRNNAHEAYLQLQPGELLLFFYDWSIWQNAKAGFAITNQRVLWKCMLGGPVITPLRHTAFQSVTAEKTMLRVSDHSVDVEDESLAAAFAQVLREICFTLNEAR
jgi:tetratricopeptide (TPR) repeat protein